MLEAKVDHCFSEVYSMKRLLLGSLSVLALSTAIAPVTSAITAEAVVRNNRTNAGSIVRTAKKPAAPAGAFVTVEQDHATVGTARIVEEDGQRYLEFDEAFDTAQGPDVQVVLHRSQPVPVNLEEENYITLAPLQSFSGTQRYALPADLDLSEYEAVAIWCREFNVTFGYAPLG